MALQGAVLLSNGAQEQDLQWHAADPAVATVSVDGRVTAIGLGNTSITATATRDPSRTAAVFLRVTQPPDPPTSGRTATSLATMAQASPAASFTFIFAGDSRNNSLSDRSGDQAFGRMLDRANQEPAAFVLLDGDLTYQGDAAEWQRFQTATARLRFPLLTAIGNHETANRAYYETAYTPPNAATGLDDYSFDYGDCRFIVLDNANGTLTDAQLDWLQRQLQTARRHKFVAMHLPPDYGDWQVHAMRAGTASARFMALAEDNGVDYVLLSHIHLFDEAVKRSNTRYLVSGGAGAPLYTQFSFGQKFNHYVKITVGPAGIAHEAVPVS